MTLQAIPTPTSNTPFLTQTSTLDGTAFILNFAYNQRADCWYLSIATVDGTDLVNGLKIVTNWPLTRKVADPDMPPGEIYCFSGTTDASPARLADFDPGGRCQLVYLPAADML